MASHLIMEYIRNNSVDELKTLIDSGFDIEIPIGDNCSHYPIHWAVILNKPEIVRLLLNNKVQINRPTTAFFTALHFSICKKYDEISRMIINHESTDLNQPNIDGTTPIGLSIRYLNKEIIELLLEKNTKLNYIDKYKKTPLDYSLKGSDIYNLLLKYNAKHAYELF
jgi:ankyrin repeat protein